ncbi:MAG: hypothetical protein A2V63_13380 [Candidatus Eisenbacteria bacterium RBG_19FT_COMBO_70_11]|nr:MAG: hypothetical protein A2V63_13380 [Candidatus Eisenbacteria bacterium RBG_19FT_COMBO_70_11]
MHVRQSTDNGQSWGGGVQAANPGVAVTFLALAYKSSTILQLFYNTGATIYTVRRSSGTWGSPAAWGNSIATCTGLCAFYYGDWNLLITGTDSGGAHQVWGVIYGDGLAQTADTWSSLRIAHTADSGSNVVLKSPFASRPDVFRASYVEKYTGTVGYARPVLSYQPLNQEFSTHAWREPTPFNVGSELGLALTQDASYVWATNPAGVWRAPRTAPALDLSADLLRLELDDRPGLGRMRAVLRNDDGRYAGLSGSYAVIRRGTQIEIGLGYRTTTGLETSTLPEYWVESYRYELSGGRSVFVLEAVNALGLIRHWRPRRTFNFAAGSSSVYELIRFVAGRAGVDLLSSGASSISTNMLPDFTIHPAESAESALSRLLGMVPDVLIPDDGGRLLMDEPLGNDSSVYAYGASGEHSILRATYSTPGPPASRLQAYGNGVFAEAFDWASIDDSFDRISQDADRNLDAGSEATDRANTNLRKAQRAAQDDAIVVPTNCGQELWDVVAVTDNRAGLSAAKRRVAGMATRYDREGAALYQQTLTLEAP